VKPWLTALLPSGATLAWRDSDTFKRTNSTEFDNFTRRVVDSDLQDR
jgi:hypothetical protein